MLRFKTEDLVEVRGPEAFPCAVGRTFKSKDGSSEICRGWKGSQRCTSGRHTICCTKLTAVGMMLVSELEFNLSTCVNVGGIKWFSLNDLARSSRTLVLPVSSVDKAKQLINAATSKDMARYDYSQTVSSVAGVTWKSPELKDLGCVSDAAGVLTIRQVLEFYVRRETGFVDFGPFKLFKDVVNNCAINLWKRNWWTPDSGEVRASSGLEKRVMDVQTLCIQLTQKTESCAQKVAELQQLSRALEAKVTDVEQQQVDQKFDGGHWIKECEKQIDTKTRQMDNELEGVKFLFCLSLLCVLGLAMYVRSHLGPQP